MQPTLAITAPVPGMIDINGRFAGEAGPDAPLFAAVPPSGAVYIAFHPLQAGFLPLARRIVLSGGAPMAQSLTDGLFAVLWPGNVTELELLPESVQEERSEPISPEGRLLTGKHPRAVFGDASFDLPPGARTARLRRTANAAFLTGEAAEGQYLLALSPDLTRQTGLLTADRIETEPPDLLRTIADRGDVAGHRQISRWRLDGSGLTPVDRQWTWTDGLPRRPANPEEAARAAVEAALLERFDEADSYLSPALAGEITLSAIGEICELVLPMKYGVPDGRSSVALVHLEEENLARVHPLYYQAEQFGDEWLLTALSLDAPENT